MRTRGCLPRFDEKILLAMVSDPALVVELKKVNDQLQAAVTSLARRLYGRATRDAVERTTCGVIDLPQGAIRRHLIAGTDIPRSVRSQLVAAIPAALGGAPNTSESQ